MIGIVAFQRTQCCTIWGKKMYNSSNSSSNLWRVPRRFPVLFSQLCFSFSLYSGTCWSLIIAACAGILRSMSKLELFFLLLFVFFWFVGWLSPPHTHTQSQLGNDLSLLLCTMSGWTWVQAARKGKKQFWWFWAWKTELC